MDDRDLIVTDETNDEKLVTEKMQNSLQLWHGLLQATGGDLVPEKCFWYLIDLRWIKDHWQYAQWEDQAHELKILHADGTKVTIPRLKTCEARRTLGVQLVPDGNNQAEFLHLRDISLSWKKALMKTNLP